MAENKFKKEWIAIHLLFPNSAQARDIFLYVITDANKLSTVKNKDLFFLKKILDIFFKTPTIQSVLSFAEFEKTQFKLWPAFFKKMSKHESAYVVCAFFYRLTISEIAELFKISPQIADLQIKKSIYKIIPKPEYRAQQTFKFNYKKYNTHKESDFFAYDQIIHQILESPDIESEKILNQISKSEQFEKYANQIFSLRNEFQKLYNSDYFIPAAQNIESNESKNSAEPTHYFNKKNIAVVLLIVGFASVLAYRPLFLQKTLNEKSTETVEIQQIKIDRHKDESVAVVPAQTEQPSAKPADFLLANEKPAEPQVVQKPTAAVIEKNKTMGGVYRGKLYVTDVQTVLNVVKEKIISLGGQKAGEVELGWMKNENTSYFHFSFPDENKDDLEDYLKQFGKSELVYEPHPRVMPKGFRRYIIEIKQNE